MKKRVKIDKNAVFSIKGPGIDVGPGFVDFDPSYTNEAIKEIFNKAGQSQTQKQVGGSNSYTPTDSQKEKVQSLLKNGATIEGFGFYKATVSSTRIDSQRDRFALSYLEEMAKQYKEGRIVAANHESKYGIGRTFDSEINQSPDGEHELDVMYYVPPSSKLHSGQSAKEAIDTGIYDRMSVSLFGVRAEFVPADKSADSRPYYVFSDTTDLTVSEVSLVGMGANQDAVIKSANTGESSFAEIEIETLENPRMKYLIKSLNKEVDVTDEGLTVVKALEKSLETAQAALSVFEAKEKAATEALKDRYLKAFNTLNPTANEIEKAAAQKKADLFANDAEILEGEVDRLEKQVAAIKAKKLDTTKAGEKKDEQSDFLSSYGL